MTSLELKRTKVELLRVTAARAELELRIEESKDSVKRRIEESQENIKRLEENIVIQIAKEVELQAKIDAESESSN